MTAWLLHSFIVGALAVACLWLCPAAWRARVRQAVPVAAFLVLLLLVIGLARPLPRLEVQAPAALARWGDAVPGAPWLFWLWAGGVVFCLANQAAGIATVWGILRASKPVPGPAWQQLLVDCQRTVGMSGRVHLRLAGVGFVPSATGLLRRTVLLPAEALRWTHEQSRLVLLHELGHFRRGDLWTHALGRLACALHWFNPCAWYLQRQLAIEREYACDALVIARGAAPTDYATLLYEMATSAHHHTSIPAAFLTMASSRTGKLEARIHRILAPALRKGKFTSLLEGTACISFIALLLVCAACKPIVRLPPASSPWTAAEISARLWANPCPGEQ